MTSKIHLDSSNHSKLSKLRQNGENGVTDFACALETFRIFESGLDCKTVGRVSPSLAPDLLFDCLRVLEYGLFCSLRVYFHSHVILRA